MVPKLAPLTNALRAFDHCFDSRKASAGAQQADIYAVVGKEVLANARDGYNACLFAYGQTGAPPPTIPPTGVG